MVRDAPRPDEDDGDLSIAPLPTDAPEDFRSAFERAAKANKPLLIVFHATWCLPCRRLEKETLGDAEVKRALSDFEIVHVDLDQNPDLAGAYRVVSVPDVFFVLPDRRIADRLREFEPKEPFLRRVEAVRRALSGE